MSLGESVLLEELREEIDQAMVNGRDDGARFVSKYRLGEIWNDHRLREFCRLVGTEEAELDKTISILRRSLLRTVSILVSIHWNDWHRFNKIFFDTRYSEDPRRDKTIKRYTVEKLAMDDFLKSERWARQFLRVREAFFPIRIQEGMVKIFERSRRLPRIESGDGVVELGVGGYGTVTKMTIAPGQYQLGRTPQLEPLPVARKVLYDIKDFEREVENLKQIRKALLKHDHVAPFLAVVSIGTEFNIFSELAIMDLKYFLDEGHSGFDISAEKLMKELTCLAHALKFLHELYIPSYGDSKAEKRRQRGPQFCCHMDLKPENVLVYRHDEHSVGLWKISDFGISRIKEAPYPIAVMDPIASANDLLTVANPLGDLKKRSTSRTIHTHAQRPSGTWTAPEVHLSDGSNVGPESDVWSFGCIFVLVCALAISTNELRDLEMKRAMKQDGRTYDPDGDCFYRKEGDRSMILNPNIESWARLLPEMPGHNQLYLRNSCHLIFSTLEIRPKERLNADQLYRALDGIFDVPFARSTGRRNPQKLLSAVENQPQGIDLSNVSLLQRPATNTPTIILPNSSINGLDMALEPEATFAPSEPPHLIQHLVHGCSDVPNGVFPPENNQSSKGKGKAISDFPQQEAVNLGVIRPTRLSHEVNGIKQISGALVPPNQDLSEPGESVPSMVLEGDDAPVLLAEHPSDQVPSELVAR